MANTPADTSNPATHPTPELAKRELEGNVVDQQTATSAAVQEGSDDGEGDPDPAG
jgi:hypothetical protein